MNLINKENDLSRQISLFLSLCLSTFLQILHGTLYQPPAFPNQAKPILCPFKDSGTLPLTMLIRQAFYYRGLSSTRLTD
jgi:hypothetical protein